MIGNLVVVKGSLYMCTGEVVEEDEKLIGIKVLHFLNGAVPEFIRRVMGTNFTYYVTRNDIIKKSSRPVKMKQQLSLEDQQPTTL